MCIQFLKLTLFLMKAVTSLEPISVHICVRCSPLGRVMLQNLGTRKSWTESPLNISRNLLQSNGSPFFLHKQDL